LAADRIVLTGDNSVLAERQAALTKLNPTIAIYTFDSTQNLHNEHGVVNDGLFTKEEISNGLLQPSSPAIKIDGHGIGI
jgi:hypothetical protein